MRLLLFLFCRVFAAVFFLPPPKKKENGKSRGNGKDIKNILPLLCLCRPPLAALVYFNMLFFHIPHRCRPAPKKIPGGYASKNKDENHERPRKSLVTLIYIKTSEDFMKQAHNKNRPNEKHK